MRYMQGTRKENAVFHDACTTEKAARAKILREVSTLLGEIVVGKKRFEELTGRLAEKLLVREGSVAEKSHTEYAVAVKDKLTA